MKHAQNTLGSGNLRLAVQLPDGEDLHEWIAVNSNDKFKKNHFLIIESICFVQSSIFSIKLICSTARSRNFVRRILVF